MQIKIAFVSFILSLSQEFRAFVLFVFCFYFRFVYPKTKFLRAILALPRPIKRAQQTLTHTLTWAIVSLTHKYTFDCWTKDNEITKNQANNEQATAEHIFVFRMTEKEYHSYGTELIAS